jgi:YD repeat-containing protein
VRLASVTDATNHTWHYSYNALGKLTQASGPNDVNRVWTYSGDLLTSETHPESGTSTYGYYPADLLTQKTDANGNVFTYSYDANERLTGSAVGGRVTTIAYEPNSDNRQVVSANGVVTTYTYDLANRMTRRQDQVGGTTYVQGFAYDEHDNLRVLTYADGRRVQYNHNAANQVMGVLDVDTRVEYARGAIHQVRYSRMSAATASCTPPPSTRTGCGQPPSTLANCT